MKLSVLLPVYNGGALLERAISSIVQQDFEDFEFIIIDDASKDDSSSLIKRVAAKDSRIRAFLHKENAGLAATLNEGLQLASTPYVARMDQDDESLPWRLRIQYIFIHSRPTVAVAGSFVYHMGMSPKQDKLVRLPSDVREIKRRLPEDNCIYHPSVILNRALVLRAGGYRHQFRNAEDYDLWLRLSRDHDLANIPVPLIRYHFTVDGMTLGRKWEQLYYVFLARASFNHPGKAWSEIERIASDRYTQVDKPGFMTAVLDGTVGELLALGYPEQASRLVEQFSGDIGSELTASANARIAGFASESQNLEQNDWLVEFLDCLRRARNGDSELNNSTGIGMTKSHTTETDPATGDRLSRSQSVEAGSHAPLAKENTVSSKDKDG